MNAFMFLCDQETEKECLQGHLFGTTDRNVMWCLEVQPGDDVYLFNYNTGAVFGPYVATSGASCHEPTAWHGKFPVQVRVSPKDTTKCAHNGDAAAPAFVKRKRPSGALGDAANDVLAWIQNVGIPVQ